MDEDAIRREMVEQLDAYLRGEIGLEDLIVWELDTNDPAELSEELSGQLALISLFADDVMLGIRPEDDLRQLALEMTGASSGSR